MPSTQHITTREAIHHDDPTEQHLLKHGSAGRREVVLGVDTHGEVHVAAVISLLGKVLATESFPATAAGYRQLLVWARKRGTVRRAGVEGTGTFGAGLSRYLLAQRIQVLEVNRPDRTARRLLGKSDPLDAQAAARAVLSGRARARAKSGDGPVHSARIYKLAKDSAVKARTQTINQLKAVLVIADPALRERMNLVRPVSRTPALQGRLS
ncbi:transposase [Streptomyces flaveolus]|uniref:IS110 family transposase n=1 Tax=Streptomyces flaveolus TaxID=67297 RepID=UPI0036FEBF14